MSAPVSGHLQFLLCSVRTEPVSKLELLDHLLHVSFGLLPKRDFSALGEPLPLPYPDPIALKRDRLHAFPENIAFDQRQRHRDDGGSRSDPDQDHGHELRIADFRIQKGKHGLASAQTWLV